MLLRSTIRVLLALSIVMCAQSVCAGSVVVSGLDRGDLRLDARQMPRIFHDQGPFFSDQSLFRMHRSLQRDGITTDQTTTFVLAGTRRGLAIMMFVDDETIRQGSRAFDSQLRFRLRGSRTSSLLVNDGSDLERLSQAFDRRSRARASGVLTWKSERRGDAIGWDALEPGDFGRFTVRPGGARFDAFPGTDPRVPYQFVTWNGSQWEVVETGRMEGEFEFHFTVIPLPAPLLMGLTGLTTLLGVRWMRTRHGRRAIN